jgi:hypothetical protein
VTNKNYKEEDFKAYKISEAFAATKHRTIYNSVTYLNAKDKRY